MSSRAFPSPFAFKKAEKKALFKFVYSRTRAYGTGTTKAPPVSPQGSGKRSFAPSLPFGRTKGFPALNRNQPSTPGHSVKSLFPSRSFNAGTGKPELCRINRHMFLPPALVSLHTHDGTVWNMNLFSRFFPVPPGTVKTDSIAQSAPYLQRKPVPASRSHKAGAWQQPDASRFSTRNKPMNNTTQPGTTTTHPAAPNNAPAVKSAIRMGVFTLAMINVSAIVSL